MAFLGLFGKKKNRLLTPDCGHQIKGSSDDEVLKLAAEHTRLVHNQQTTPEMAEKLRKMIKAA